MNKKNIQNILMSNYKKNMETLKKRYPELAVRVEKLKILKDIYTQTKMERILIFI